VKVLCAIGWCVMKTEYSQEQLI